MNKDTRQIIIAIMSANFAIIVSVITAAIMAVNVSQVDSSELRGDMRELHADMRELRGLLITHIAGHAHAVGEVVAKVDNVEAVKE